MKLEFTNYLDPFSRTYLHGLFMTSKIFYFIILLFIGNICILRITIYFVLSLYLHVIFS